MCLDGGFLSYIRGKVVCVRDNLADKHTELIVDGIVTDTGSGLPFYTRVWFGNYIEANDKIIKIDIENFKFDEIFELWIDNDGYPAKFYKNKKGDDFVSYSGKDLTEGR